jgi:hypothetical protein
MSIQTKRKSFLRDHPLGVAVTDIGIAAALLCCEGAELVELKDNPKSPRETVFVIKGDKEFLAKRAFQFFRSRIDGKKLQVGEEGMAVAAMFSQKMRELKMAAKNRVRGQVEVR